MKTAVIYARYSSERQTEQSIEGQLRVCQEYAKRENIVVVGTYIDRAMTGTNDNRVDFQRMIKDSNRREWDYIIVYKLDRFSRDKYATAIYKKTLKDNGVKLLSATECIPDTPEGIIVESLIEGMGQFYSVELSQKVKRGMNESRRKGNFTGGYLIYGYKVENKKILIDEDKAEIVRQIFDKFLQGVPVLEIIRDLKEQGVMNRGKPFARNTVHRLLRNEKYTGVYRYGEEVFENIYPAIISKETYERAMEKSAVREYGKRSTEVIYYLRNKLKCGYCGHPITGETGTARNGSIKRYYKCSGRKHHNGCQKARVKKDQIEDMIITTIIRELSKPEILDSIVNNLLEVQEKQLVKNGIIPLLVQEKKQVDKATENMLKAIEQGVITETTAKRLKELEAKQKEIEAKILIEQSKGIVRISASDIRKYYKDALRYEARALISYLVKEVIFYDDKIEIYFSKPTRNGPDENRGFSFCLDTAADGMAIQLIIK